MSKVFFIADTHFGHEYIFKKMERPFAGVAEMDAAIIERWNKAVSKDDTVWILGDYSLRDFFATRRITESLCGKKILLRGNHDKQDDDFFLKSGIFKIYDMPVLYEGKYLLSHEPVSCGEGFVNLFGHVHVNADYPDFSPTGFCLSCERIGYTPVSIEEIEEKTSAVITAKE